MPETHFDEFERFIHFIVYVCFVCVCSMLQFSSESKYLFRFLSLCCCYHIIVHNILLQLILLYSFSARSFWNRDRYSDDTIRGMFIDEYKVTKRLSPIKWNGKQVNPIQSSHFNNLDFALHFKCVSWWRWASETTPD